MKNEFLAFAVLAVAAVALIGGIGYTLYCGAYFIAVCIAALGVLAFPTLYEAWQIIKK